MFTQIFGVSICLALVALFVFVRVKRGGVAGLVTKALASLGFVVFAIFLQATKVGQNQFSVYATALVICGLICGLVGDILLDLKVIYPFHEDKYLTCGMTSFLVGHLCFNAAMILMFVDKNSSSLAIPLVVIIAASAILAVAIWLVTSRYIGLNYGRHATFSTIYAGILLFTTIFSIYLAIATTLLPIIILSAGFVLFLASDLVLSLQYFGGKQNNKTLIIANHLLYYFAQIIIAFSIYYI